MTDVFALSGQGKHKLRTSSMKRGSLTSSSVKTPHQHEALFPPTFLRKFTTHIRAQTPSHYGHNAFCSHSCCLPASSAPRAM